MQQKDALTILLTGRGETAFAELLKRIAASKGLEFDIISLKPVAGPNNQRFSSTMNFKQAFLESLMETYKGAEEIRVLKIGSSTPKVSEISSWNYNRRQNGLAGHPPVVQSPQKLSKLLMRNST